MPYIVQDGGYKFTAMGSDLAEAVSSLFETLLDGPVTWSPGSSRKILVDCRYGYSLGKGMNPPLVVYLPVTRIPSFSFVLKSARQSQPGSLAANLVNDISVI